MFKQADAISVDATPKVRVLGLAEMRHEDVEEADFIFSITDHAKVRLTYAPVPGKVLRVYFEDTEQPDEDELLRMSHSVRLILVAAMVKQFSPEHRLIVHCHAGVSRSSAMAWALLVQMGLGIEEAFRVLWHQRPKMWPNQIVLDLADDFLRLGGELSQFGQKVNAEIAENYKSMGYARP